MGMEGTRGGPKWHAKKNSPLPDNDLNVDPKRDKLGCYQLHHRRLLNNYVFSTYYMAEAM